MFGFIKKIFSSTPSQMPAGTLGMAELSKRLAMSADELRGVAIVYKQFNLPKRGGGGMRTVSAPSDALKNVQRRILHRLLRKLRAHPAATGFERGHSIVSNALPHVGQEVVIKLDLKDFFTSTKASRVDAYFRKIGWDAECAALMAKLCTYEGALPQGAPTSPRLSNLLNFPMDARLAAAAEARQVAYSRYADDMTFSGQAISESGGNIDAKSHGKKFFDTRTNDLIFLVKHIASEYGYKLHTDKKLRIARRNCRQSVTGLIVNKKVGLPRETRRRLRAIEHRLKTRGKATLTEEQLAGWKSLQKMIAMQSSPQE